MSRFKKQAEIEPHNDPNSVRIDSVDGHAVGHTLAEGVELNEPYVRLHDAGGTIVGEAVTPATADLDPNMAGDLPMPNPSLFALPGASAELTAAKAEVERLRSELDSLERKAAEAFENNRWDVIADIHAERNKARLILHGAELAAAELEVAQHDAHARILFESMPPYASVFRAKEAEAARAIAEAERARQAIAQFNQWEERSAIRRGAAEARLSELSRLTPEDVMNARSQRPFTGWVEESGDAGGEV